MNSILSPNLYNGKKFLENKNKQNQNQQKREEKDNQKILND